MGDGRPVSTKEIADEIGKSLPQTRRILAKLERLGYAKRVGERGGWVPSQPPVLDLYSICGLPKPERSNSEPAPR
jgi:DNA-binding IscR family transcriptional regulator